LKKPEATIFEITAERLRRAGAKIEAELAAKDATKKEASGALFMTADGTNGFQLDTGFRVYELSDDPNALILRKSLADATQADVLALQEAIATPQPEQEPQILANLLLAEGLPLSSNFEPLIAASPQAVQVVSHSAGDVAFVLHAVPLEDLVDALRQRKARGQTVQHICVYAPWVDDDNFLQGISTLLEAEGYGSERLRLRG
jgi:adenine-specific DNA-methyltransferase